MTDVFDQNTDNNAVAPVNPPAPVDKLKTILNEQGQPKYDTVDKALDSLVHSQEHIKRLEEESRIRDEEILRLREAEVRAKSLEDIVQQLQQSNNSPATQATPQNAGMSEEATIKALENIIAKRDAQATAKANLDLVQSTLLTKFGDEAKTKQAVADKARELGLTPQELGALSSKSPKAVLAYFGEMSKIVNPVTPSQNSPLNPPNIDEPLKRPEKSLLSGVGATDANRKALMAEIKQRVYKRLDVTT